jgi:hypothetical protein
LSAITLGDAEATVELAALPDGMRIRVELTAADWEVTLGAVLPAGASVIEATVNGEAVPMHPAQGAEHEGRATWLAPPRRGATRYDLHVSWSINGQALLP